MNNNFTCFDAECPEFYCFECGIFGDCTYCEHVFGGESCDDCIFGLKEEQEP